jgi:hypothetical protein
LPLPKYLIFAIITLVIAHLGSITVPVVHAQSVTVVIDHPVASSPIGSSIRLTSIVSYSNLKINWAVLVALIDSNTNSIISSARGTVPPCIMIGGSVMSGGCIFIVQKSSGSENVTLDFQAPQIPQTLVAYVSAIVFTNCCTPIYGQNSNIITSAVSPKVSISIISQVQTTTTSIMTTYSSSVQISTSSSNPSSPQTPQITFNPVLFVPIIVVIVVVLLALKFKSREEKQKSSGTRRTS